MVLSWLNGQLITLYGAAVMTNLLVAPLTVATCCGQQVITPHHR